MSRNRRSRYPSHLARLVATRLRERDLKAPPDKVLLRLLETVYFASLKTDEGRPCVCTVNYVDPHGDRADPPSDSNASRWTTIRFRQPIPLNVRNLTKLAEAAHPTVSSLAVFSDDSGELFVWGMVDQELGYNDHAALDETANPQRPGLVQVTITGVGNICVYRNYSLLGSLEQNSLIAEYHDVLWAGPVHRMLKRNLRSTLAHKPASFRRTAAMNDVVHVKDELLVRWQNAICRVLFHVQQYRHGGGLLIVPRCPAPQVHVKYQLRYDRLPRALFELAQHELLQKRTADSIAQHCRNEPGDVLPCDVHFDAMEYQRKLEEHKSEASGCVRFIASLSRVDGFVLLDKTMVVHGFGVEARSDCDLADVYVAGDAKASPRLLHQAQLSQFGTRHRAMMRYCHENEGALGFVVSQDGDIRATARVRNRLILWENINVQVGLKRERHATPISDFEPMTGLFKFWVHSLASSGRDRRRRA